MARGVRLVPSALSRLISRSKVMQAAILGPWMPPHTYAAYTIHQLQELLASPLAGRAVITKLDRKDAGLGIHYWRDIEDVYTQASLGTLGFPFVVQEFIADSRDVRVIVIGDYVEAYERHNPHGFRNNLHWGGRAAACDLTPAEETICREVMARGRFPYAHIDLLRAPDGTSYLMEINLRGGIRGARISPRDYQRRIAQRHEELLAR